MSVSFLEVEDVQTHFPVESGFVFKRRVGTGKAVDGVTFSLRKGEVLGLVGESGCGKSTLGRTILQLIPATSGNVILEGRNLDRLKDSQLRHDRVRDRHPVNLAPFEFGKKNLRFH
jgi:oligopeptide transport system ATP-binding protein